MRESRHSEGISFKSDWFVYIALTCVMKVAFIYRKCAFMLSFLVHDIIKTLSGQE